MPPHFRKEHKRLPHKNVKKPVLELDKKHVRLHNQREL